MDLRRLLVVLLVIAVVLVSSFFLLNYDETVKYNRVSLTNTSSIEMPISDQSTTAVVHNGINLINDTKHDLTVMYFNSAQGNQVAFIGNHVTHDNILIICKDPEMLEHIITSVKYQYFNEETNSTETITGDNASAVDNASAAVDSTKSASNQSSSSNVPAGYYWSGQDADYIREYDDANGVHHIDRLHGPNEAIDTVNNKHYTNGVEDTEAYNKDFN